MKASFKHTRKISAGSLEKSIFPSFSPRLMMKGETPPSPPVIEEHLRRLKEEGEGYHLFASNFAQTQTGEEAALQVAFGGEKNEKERHYANSKRAEDTEFVCANAKSLQQPLNRRNSHTHTENPYSEESNLPSLLSRKEYQQANSLESLRNRVLKELDTLRRICSLEGGESEELHEYHRMQIVNTNSLKALTIYLRIFGLVEDGKEGAQILPENPQKPPFSDCVTAEGASNTQEEESSPKSDKNTKKAADSCPELLPSHEDDAKESYEKANPSSIPVCAVEMKLEPAPTPLKPALHRAMEEELKALPKELLEDSNPREEGVSEKRCFSLKNYYESFQAMQAICFIILELAGELYPALRGATSMFNPRTHMHYQDLKDNQIVSQTEDSNNRSSSSSQESQKEKNKPEGGGGWREGLLSQACVATTHHEEGLKHKIQQQAHEGPEGISKVRVDVKSVEQEAGQQGDEGSNSLYQACVATTHIEEDLKHTSSKKTLEPLKQPNVMQVLGKDSIALQDAKRSLSLHVDNCAYNNNAAEVMASANTRTAYQEETNSIFQGINYRKGALFDEKTPKSFTLSEVYEYHWKTLLHATSNEDLFPYTHMIFSRLLRKAFATPSSLLCEGLRGINSGGFSQSSRPEKATSNGSEDAKQQRASSSSSLNDDQLLKAPESSSSPEIEQKKQLTQQGPDDPPTNQGKQAIFSLQESFSISQAIEEQLKNTHNTSLLDDLIASLVRMYPKTYSKLELSSGGLDISKISLTIDESVSKQVYDLAEQERWQNCSHHREEQQDKATSCCGVMLQEELANMCEELDGESLEAWVSREAEIIARREDLPNSSASMRLRTIIEALLEAPLFTAKNAIGEAKNEEQNDHSITKGLENDAEGVEKRGALIKDIFAVCASREADIGREKEEVVGKVGKTAQHTGVALSNFYQHQNETLAELMERSGSQQEPNAQATHKTHGQTETYNQATHTIRAPYEGEKHSFYAACGLKRWDCTVSEGGRRHRGSSLDHDSPNDAPMPNRCFSNDFLPSSKHPHVHADDMGSKPSFPFNQNTRNLQDNSDIIGGSSSMVRGSFSDCLGESFGERGMQQAALEDNPENPGLRGKNLGEVKLHEPGAHTYTPFTTEVHHLRDEDRQGEKSSNYASVWDNTNHLPPSAAHTNCFKSCSHTPYYTQKSSFPRMIRRSPFHQQEEERQAAEAITPSPSPPSSVGKDSEITQLTPSPPTHDGGGLYEGDFKEKTTSYSLGGGSGVRGFSCYPHSKGYGREMKTSESVAHAATINKGIIEKEDKWSTILREEFYKGHQSRLTCPAVAASLDDDYHNTQYHDMAARERSYYHHHYPAHTRRLSGGRQYATSRGISPSHRYSPPSTFWEDEDKEDTAISPQNLQRIGTHSRSQRRAAKNFENSIRDFSSDQYSVSSPRGGWGASKTADEDIYWDSQLLLLTLAALIAEDPEGKMASSLGNKTTGRDLLEAFLLQDKGPLRTSSAFLMKLYKMMAYQKSERRRRMLIRERERGRELDNLSMKLSFSQNETSTEGKYSGNISDESFMGYSTDSPLQQNYERAIIDKIHSSYDETPSPSPLLQPSSFPFSAPLHPHSPSSNEIPLHLGRRGQPTHKRGYGRKKKRRGLPSHSKASSRKRFSAQHTPQTEASPPAEALPHTQHSSTYPSSFSFEGNPSTHLPAKGGRRGGMQAEKHTALPSSEQYTALHTRPGATPVPSSEEQSGGPTLHTSDFTHGSPPSDDYYYEDGSCCPFLKNEAQEECLNAAFSKETGVSKGYRRGVMSKAGYPNVSFDVTHNRWIALWRENGRYHSKSFSCNKFGGRESARVKAIAFRRQIEEKLRFEGVESAQRCYRSGVYSHVNEPRASFKSEAEKGYLQASSSLVEGIGSIQSKEKEEKPSLSKGNPPSSLVGRKRSVRSPSARIAERKKIRLLADDSEANPHTLSPILEPDIMSGSLQRLPHRSKAPKRLGYYGTPHTTHNTQERDYQNTLPYNEKVHQNFHQMSNDFACIRGGGQQESVELLSAERMRENPSQKPLGDDEEDLMRSLGEGGQESTFPLLHTLGGWDPPSVYHLHKASSTIGNLHNKPPNTYSYLAKTENPRIKSELNSVLNPTATTGGGELPSDKAKLSCGGGLGREELARLNSTEGGTSVHVGASEAAVKGFKTLEEGAKHRALDESKGGMYGGNNCWLLGGAGTRGKGQATGSSGALGGPLGVTNRSKVVSGSITYDRSQNRFMTQWKTSDGTKHSKSFYIKNYGTFEEAKQMAAEFRKQLLVDRDRERALNGWRVPIRKKRNNIPPSSNSLQEVTELTRHVSTEQTELLKSEGLNMKEASEDGSIARNLPLPPPKKTSNEGDSLQATASTEKIQALPSKEDVTESHVNPTSFLLAQQGAQESHTHTAKSVEGAQHTRGEGRAARRTFGRQQFLQSSKNEGLSSQTLAETHYTTGRLKGFQYLQQQEVTLEPQTTHKKEASSSHHAILQEVYTVEEKVAKEEATQKASNTAEKRLGRCSSEDVLKGLEDEEAKEVTETQTTTNFPAFPAAHSRAEDAGGRKEEQKAKEWGIEEEKAAENAIGRNFDDSSVSSPSSSTSLKKTPPLNSLIEAEESAAFKGLRGKNFVEGVAEVEKEQHIYTEKLNLSLGSARPATSRHSHEAGSRSNQRLKTRGSSRASSTKFIRGHTQLKATEAGGDHATFLASFDEASHSPPSPSNTFTLSSLPSSSSPASAYFSQVLAENRGFEDSSEKTANTHCNVEPAESSPKPSALPVLDATQTQLLADNAQPHEEKLSASLKRSFRAINSLPHFCHTHNPLEDEKKVGPLHTKQPCRPPKRRKEAILSPPQGDIEQAEDRKTKLGNPTSTAGTPKGAHTQEEQSKTAILNSTSPFLINQKFVLKTLPEAAGSDESINSEEAVENGRASCLKRRKKLYSPRDSHMEIAATPLHHAQQTEGACIASSHTEIPKKSYSSGKEFGDTHTHTKQEENEATMLPHTTAECDETNRSFTHTQSFADVEPRRRSPRGVCVQHTLRGSSTDTTTSPSSSNSEKSSTQTMAAAEAALRKKSSKLVSQHTRTVEERIEKPVLQDETSRASDLPHITLCVGGEEESPMKRIACVKLKEETASGDRFPGPPSSTKLHELPNLLERLCAHTEPNIEDEGKEKPAQQNPSSISIGDKGKLREGA